MSKSFWSTLFAPARERFSLEELQHLHQVLLRNQVVTDANRDTVVEALRSISELVIWGDQHDPSMVEYFLTENLLGHFHEILQHRANRRGEVATQVLQTLSILIQNLRTQQTIYCLFSNDHINCVVALRFDFEDDEVLGYYVNLLKTISLQLNPTTVQFFLQQDPITGVAAFPLYTEACKFLAHRDGMVRAAVKTLTLNVYAIELPALRRFLCADAAAVAYFDHLAAYAVGRCAALDLLLCSWDVDSAQTPGAVESCLADIEDTLSYCNDVLAAGVAPLSSLLLDRVWRQVVGPALFWPLMQGEEPLGAESGGASPSGRLKQGAVGPLCSLYVFECLYRAITDVRLLSLLAAALLGGPAKDAAAALIASLDSGAGLGEGERVHRSGGASGEARGAADMEDAGPAAAAGSVHGSDLSVESLLAGLQYSPGAFRTAFLNMVCGGDAQVAAAATRVLAALLASRALPEETLEVVGLLPRRRRKQRELLEALTRESSMPTLDGTPTCTHADSHAAAAPLPTGQEHPEKHPYRLTPSADTGEGARVVAAFALNDVSVGDSPAPSPRPAHEAAQQPQGTEGGDPAAGAGDDAAQEMESAQAAAAAAEGVDAAQEMESAEAAVHAAAEADAAAAAAAGVPTPEDTRMATPEIELSGRYWPHREAWPPTAGGPDASPTASGDAHFNQAVASMLRMLREELAPPLGLVVAGWTLQKLLTTGGGGAALTPQWRALLADAVASRREAAKVLLRGPWCDALLPLVQLAWQRSRQGVLRTGPGSLHVAACTWVQGALVQDLQWQLGGAAEAVAAANSAAAAKLTWTRLQALVTVLQIQQVLETGDIAADPPVPAPHAGDVATGELHEGDLCTLPTLAWPCSVSFAPGRERQVLLGISGLPADAQAVASDSEAALAAEAQEQGPDQQRVPPRCLSSLAATAGSPAAVVLDPAVPAAAASEATALSIAPLAGAAASIDEAHPAWLHVEVRPPTSTLLGALRAASPGTDVLTLGRQLSSGHWVLSFGKDAAAAAAAAAALEGAAHAWRRAHAQALVPLLGDSSEVVALQSPVLASRDGRSGDAAPPLRESQAPAADAQQAPVQGSGLTPIALLLDSDMADVQGDASSPQEGAGAERGSDLERGGQEIAAPMQDPQPPSPAAASPEGSQGGGQVAPLQHPSFPGVGVTAEGPLAVGESGGEEDPAAAAALHATLQVVPAVPVAPG